MKEKAHPFPGYLAPSIDGCGPLVVVLPSWWGLNDFYRQLCVRLAAQGFTAFAPDYLPGMAPANGDETRRLQALVDRNAVHKLLKQAITFLKEQDYVRGWKIGVVGFSLGGSFAANLARMLPADVAAVVLFYGIPAGKFDRVNAAFQGHFAAQDERGAGHSKVASLQRKLLNAGLEASFYSYIGAEHGFFEKNLETSYHPPAAELAWGRMTAFLQDKLTN